MQWFLAGVDGFRWMWLGFPAVIVRGLRVCDFGGLFFFLFFFFRLLVVMRLWVWVCDLVVYFSFFCLLVVMRLWVWDCDFGG